MRTLWQLKPFIAGFVLAIVVWTGWSARRRRAESLPYPSPYPSGGWGAQAPAAATPERPPSPPPSRGEATATAEQAPPSAAEPPSAQRPEPPAEPTPDSLAAAGVEATTPPTASEAGQGWVEGDGSPDCPDGYPIKGNATSRIYHLPGQSSYHQTVPEICFASEADAAAAGFRARKG